VVLVIAVAGVMASHAPGGELDEKSPQAMVVGLLICGCLISAIVGGVLGAVGLTQRNRHKVFPALGLALNGLIILGTALLIILGTALG
jgi:hypothetical protein